METRVVKIKSDFNDIINIRNVVKNVFDTLHIRIDSLGEIYADFIKSNKSDIFVFGLDSFHFQSKLIDIEYHDMKRLFLVINNRMYCEYFKLHKIIVEYISTIVTDKKITDLVKINNFPVYKDLEPFKEYKFEIILDIHENILNLLGVLISTLNNKENELSIHKTKQDIGLNIDNFITSFNFNISIMREKIIMFITYIEFFHKMHSKYLKRFSNKIQLMYTHISNDIKFDDSIEITKNKKKELINEFSINNMDKTLLKDLKTSIGSETNSEASDGTKSNITTSNSKVLETSHSLLSLTYPSPENPHLNNKSTSLFGIKPLNEDKEKKDYKKIFQKNVHKVTDMLQLFKPKKDKIIEFRLSDKDVEKMFYGIEETCNSIINEKKEIEPDNIKLHTNSFDNEEINSNDEINITKELISTDFVDNHIIDTENGEKKIESFDIINNTILENVTKLEELYINEEQNEIIDKIQDIIVEESKIQEIINEKKEEIINEESKEEQIVVQELKYEESKPEENKIAPIESSEIGKKKRTYKRKNK